MANLDLQQIRRDLSRGIAFSFNGMRLGEKQWHSLLPLLLDYPKELIPVLPSRGAAHVLEAYVKSLYRFKAGSKINYKWPSKGIWMALVERLDPKDTRGTVWWCLRGAAERWITMPIPLSRRSAYQALLSSLLEKINWNHPDARSGNKKRGNEGAWELMLRALETHTLPQVLEAMLPYLDVPARGSRFMDFVPEWDRKAPPLHGLDKEPVVWDWLMSITSPEVLGRVAAEVLLVGRKDEARILIEKGALAWDWPMRAVWDEAVDHDRVCNTQKVADLKKAIVSLIDDPRKSKEFRSKLYESCKVIRDHVLLERYRLDELKSRPCVSTIHRRPRA